MIFGSADLDGAELAQMIGDELGIQFPTTVVLKGLGLYENLIRLGEQGGREQKVCCGE